MHAYSLGSQALPVDIDVGNSDGNQHDGKRQLHEAKEVDLLLGFLGEGGHGEVGTGADERTNAALVRGAYPCCAPRQAKIVRPAQWSCLVFLGGYRSVCSSSGCVRVSSSYLSCDTLIGGIGLNIE